MAQVQPNDPALEIDTDSDSAYSESVGSASYKTSLSASIRDYKYENGRRYHAYREGTYVLPNDEDEQDRMDLLHHIYLLTLGGKLHMAPIGSNPQRVLDIGTGTGIWAIDFADQNPSAQVIGTDLSPIQPQWVPPNCSFEIDDFESDWAFSHDFDFVHGRELNGSVSDWDQLFGRSFRHLKSGGYLEIQTGEAEFFADDGSDEKVETCKVLVQNLHEAAEKFGKPLSHIYQWKEKMEKAGFEDVTWDIFKVPIGPWPKDPKLKELGKFQGAQQLEAVGTYTMALFTRILGWSREEVEVLCAAVRNEIKSKSSHLYIKAHFVYGRKP